MATKLSLEAMHELTMVFRQKNGQEWGPRNEEARLLSVKGKPVDENKRGFVSDIIERMKAWYLGADAMGNDYDGLVSLLCQAWNDIQNAFCINEDDVRDAAIPALLDKFAAAYDSMRGSEKAGKRHSAADQASIDAANAAHAKLGKALASAQAEYDNVGGALNGLKPAQQDPDGDGDADASKAIVVEPGPVGEDGLPESYTAFGHDADQNAAARKAFIEKADKEPYGDVEYADPGYQSDKKKRYPIDTKEHAKAAWSYINKESNASKYSSDDLAKVKSKIKAACEKFGVEIGDDSSKSGEVEMTQEQIDALVAEAATKAAEAAATKTAESLKAAAQTEIDEANAAAKKAKEVADQAIAEADAAKAERKAAEDALNGKAATPSSKSGESNEPKWKRSGSLEAAVKAANRGAAVVTPVGRPEDAAS